MSVYKPKRSSFWAYDFVIKGDRYHGSTGQETRRAAEAFERRLRSQIASGEFADAGDLTLDVAAAKWFDECVRGSRSADDTERRLGMMAQCVGANRRLRQINGLVISEAIQKRRAIFYRGHMVANATVNRDVLAPLRSILRRARIWGARNMPEIPWRELFLPEAAAVVREFTDEEQARWRDELGSDVERVALRLMLRYGVRFGEAFFHPAKVDPIGRRLTISGRKATEYADLSLPLLDEDALALGKLAAEALARGDDNVWGLTYWQLHHRLSDAARRAGIAPGRIIHGMRHHAGTQIARKGGLHLAKRLLGHASITSTVRYAHAMEHDLRTALESESRNSPGSAPAKARKTLKDQG